MVFAIAFLPDCGNKYFLAAVDDGIRLYDLESCTVRYLIRHLPCYEAPKFANY